MNEQVKTSRKRAEFQFTAKVAKFDPAYGAYNEPWKLLRSGGWSLDSHSMVFHNRSRFMQHLRYIRLRRDEGMSKDGEASV